MSKKVDSTTRDKMFPEVHQGKPVKKCNRNVTEI